MVDGCYFLFCSNSLPAISNFSSYPLEYKNDWVPMESRCELIEMKQSFTGNKFPYEAPVLAHCIKALLSGGET